ncbi:hypothetical protein AB0J01_28215 [Streptomyces sp. NPDC050204]|uniref:hypothetical protein n=1 Tax=Streptomyces sp. NPDC050204 TaxID=3155514 RepID=UPI0034324C2C
MTAVDLPAPDHEALQKLSVDDKIRVRTTRGEVVEAVVDAVLDGRVSVFVPSTCQHTCKEHPRSLISGWITGVQGRAADGVWVEGVA